MVIYALGQIIRRHRMQPVIKTHDNFVGTRRSQFRQRSNWYSHELLPLLVFVERIDHLKSPFYDAEIHDLSHLAGTQKGNALHTALGKITTQLSAASSCLAVKLKRKIQELVGQSRFLRETMWSEEIIPSASVFLLHMKKTSRHHLLQYLMGQLHAHT